MSKKLSTFHRSLWIFVFSCSRHRCPHEEPEHLKVEGDFYTPEKEHYKPVEKPKPFKPQDNLIVEGTFEGRRTEDYQVHKFERSQIVRREDNLKISDGEFYSQTTNKSSYQREIEEDQPLRRNTYTKEEDDLNEKSIRRRTWTKEELEAVRQKAIDDEKPKYKPIDRPQQVKPTDNLRPEGDFYSPEKDRFVPADRPKQVRPSDNLRPEGDFVRDKKPDYQQSERPQQVKPTDNLRPEGDFYTPEKDRYVQAERPKQVNLEDF